MSETKRVIIIDPNLVKGQKEFEILNEIYPDMVCWIKNLGRNNKQFYLDTIDINSESIDLIVVANGFYVVDILKKHKEYAIPTILRVDRGFQVSSEIFAQVGNLEYWPVIMIGLEQKVEAWKMYIAEAQQKVQTFRK